MLTQTVSNDQVELYTESFGDPRDPSCLLIAGAQASARFWTDHFCEALVDKGYHVIRFDHRDIGLSAAVDFEKHPYSLGDLAADCVRILENYGVERAHVIGHSMGGYIAQHLALEHREWLLSISIISAGPIAATEATDQPPTEAERVLWEKTWSVMLGNHPTQDFEASRDGYMQVWRYLSGDSPVDEQLATAYTRDFYERSNHAAGVVQNHLKVMLQMSEEMENRRGTLATIQLPTLVIHGASDPLVLLKRGGEALAGAIPGAKLAVVPNMGHMLFSRELENLVLEQLKMHLS